MSKASQIMIEKQMGQYFHKSTMTNQTRFLNSKRPKLKSSNKLAPFMLYKNCFMRNSSEERTRITRSQTICNHSNVTPSKNDSIFIQSSSHTPKITSHSKMREN
mmetsp:Transcript_27516/g.24395  ORF Transcript_27516/g.24395 Transcript_27516/m.24395 type:complete len:104 (-) Transcript_27516:195-506(-)